MNNITKGKRKIFGKELQEWVVNDDDLMRIYDRLRKRSYRKWQYMSSWGQWRPQKEHEAYVKGVKDALNEIADGG